MSNNVQSTFLPCYLETNTSNPSNFAKYSLSGGASPFSLCILFAANLNGTPDAPELSFNEKLQPIMDSGIISELQGKGLKVSLSILPNHQTAGLSTLTPTGVTSFANQLIRAVKQYGLDGLDFDDEYTAPGAPEQPASFVILLQQIRNALPTTLLTMYAIGPIMQYLSYDGVDAGSLLDYAWNPYYSTYNAPLIPGATNGQLAAAAVNITSTPTSMASEFAERTLSDGYGVYMTYNLVNGDQSEFLSSVTNVLYGQMTEYNE
ncbi:endo-beta-N-acetylglucosaminidase family protein [Arenicella sp. 4NH20-0111]|uniref:glycosyl hydrolase family 18 protein n=1 Tax=Arenicella sp. 4NH20-0111 TaxID=3127648 RepID=UPI003103DA11